MLSSKLYKQSAIKRELLFYRCSLFQSDGAVFYRACSILACLQVLLEVSNWNLRRLVGPHCNEVILCIRN